MSRKTFLADYFTFSKMQRRSLLLALSLIVACLLVRFSYRYFVATETLAADTTFLQQAARLALPDTSQKPFARYTASRYSKEEDGDVAYREPADDYSSRKYKPRGELFPFDPNTLDAAGWKRLGLRDKIVATIQNYRARGGRFREAADLRRIYGLFPDEAERLLPYVRIATSTNGYAVAKAAPPVPQESSIPFKSALPRIIDINQADTSAFISLPGIGSKLAARIIGFRQKLGGFHSISQVGETYGLPDSVFQQIRPRLVVGAVSVQKININTADANAMKANPYIRWNVANAIFQYRQQHGNYAALNDLKKIALIDEQLFLKLEPYLTVE